VRNATEANVELARRFYALWNTGGVEAVTEQLVAPDLVFYDIPEVPDGGIFRGAQAFAERLRAITEGLSHMQFEVRSLEERGDYVLATVVMRAEGATSGVKGAAPQFHVSRWTEGRLREFRAYLDSNQAREEYQRLSTQSD
jgi:ketosteroid isomerase-like protein